MKLPKVSVIMPVFNGEKYVSDAVNSILTQSFTDFEFIIIDDGSIDSTFRILKSFNDNRINLIRKIKNGGHNVARNEGMEIAKGKYICMMDSDDIALPHRIQKQFEFMELNKQFGLCGSFVKICGSNEIISAPQDYDEIKVWSLSNIMFRHPTIFIRSRCLKKYNLKYSYAFRYAADYDFLVRGAHFFPVTNIREVLLEYRKHSEQISSACKAEQSKVVYQTILNQLIYFEINASEEEKNIHLALMSRLPIKNEREFEQRKKWAGFLLERNSQSANYSSVHLAFFLKCLLKYQFKQYALVLSKNNCTVKFNT